MAPFSTGYGGIKLTVGKQTGVSSDLGPVELQFQTAVKIDPKTPLFQFTHRVRLVAEIGPLAA